MAPISFRNSKIVYYGPHSCDNCGVLITKMSTDWGGTSFTYPDGPIYPNTEWHPHVCDPALVRKRMGASARDRVLSDWPHAFAYATAHNKGFVILAEPPATPDYEHVLVISPNQTYFKNEEDAWSDALRRQTDGLPTWHLDFGRDHCMVISNDLDSLPECPDQ